ncbi:sensor histidine kinase [Saccharibacter floricola]|uniref:histidine kinase n=1 Tax=Saccharibacter floricola DSM 15669 TaxID=1123227 RepID=A0ABQ0NYT8_9PROT|nr:ATP-binding protein [Saccharibacter floricola]GBQ06171.1 two component sensor histidine kinase PhoR [Saccharibacter floricola DSM 15669]
MPWWMGALLACVTVLMMIGWSCTYWLLRRQQNKAAPVRKSAPTARLSDDALMECFTALPADVVILSPMGEVLGLNPETHAQFGDRLGVVLRHPTMQSLLDAALRIRKADKAVHYPVCSASITLDVPMTWTAHVAVRYVKLPYAKEPFLVAVLSDRSEAQAVDRMRVDFVSHASHELRTPLAALSGFIDMLRHDDAFEAHHGRSLSMMSQQAERMRRLIDRLLYLSRVQARAHQRPSQDVDVDDVMALVVGDVAHRFENGRARLTLDVEEGLLIQADEDEMIQVFLNLIENALKYGEQPQQTLHIRLFGRTVTPDDPLWPGTQGVVLGVQDNGCGIEPQHVPRLTERFYRVRQQQAEKTGSGLGLSIVKHIIDRHGGRFRIQSTVGEGTIFLLWLPSLIEKTNEGSCHLSVIRESPELHTQ